MHNEMAQDLLNVLRKYADKPCKFENYQNPHFCAGITEIIWNYYEMEDEEVNQRIQDWVGM